MSPPALVGKVARLCPVLGLLFLRYAEKRFAEAEARIGPIGSGTRRKIGKEDYHAEGVIFLLPHWAQAWLEMVTRNVAANVVDNLVISLPPDEPSELGCCCKRGSLEIRWYPLAPTRRTGLL